MIRISESRMRQIIREELEGDGSEARDSWASNALEAGIPRRVGADGITLIHRSPSSISVNDLDAEAPRVSKQSRRGKGRTVGVYMYDATGDDDADRKFGSHKVMIEIPPGTAYLDLIGSGINTSRITDNAAAELRDAGFDLVRGRDFIGPPEWIILSNTLLKEASMMSHTRITESRLKVIIREELDRFDDRAIVVLGSTFAGPVYVVAYDRRELERAVEHERARNPAAPDPGDYFGVIAGLTLKRNNEYGECNGAWRVTTAASNEKGWGTKVYLAAFEWLRNISSDRTSVSPSAEGMWKSLARKGIVEPEPFDNWKNPQTPPTSDDCKVFPSRDPVLNSSFRIKGSIPPEVSQLLDDGDEHLRSLGNMRSNAEKLLRAGIGNLFVNLYDN